VFAASVDLEKDNKRISSKFNPNANWPYNKYGANQFKKHAY